MKREQIIEIVKKQLDEIIKVHGDIEFFNHLGRIAIKFKDGTWYRLKIYRSEDKAVMDEPSVSECEWVEDNDWGYFSTSCGNEYCLIDGTLEENKHRYCPYCGKKIKTEK